MTGSGTEADPYVIWDATDLQNVNNDLTAYYILGCNIDASATVGWNGGLGFVPIGQAPPYFTGHFDGKGYTISGLVVNRPLESNVGLIGYTDGATISNLRVEGTITGDDDVGGLAGNLYNGIISQCSTNVTIVGDRGLAGGFAGLIYGAVEVIDCHSEGTVDEGAAPFIAYGGFAGWIGLSAVITRCYSTVDVTAPNASEVGGFVGYCSEATFSRCYSIGDVYGDSIVGGFVGIGAFGNGVTTNINDCYSRGAIRAVWDAAGFCNQNGNWANCTLNINNCYFAGTLVSDQIPPDPIVDWLAGFFYGELLGTVAIANCFWDTELSGVSNSLYGTGKTTAEMKLVGTFQAAEWAISRIWNVLAFCNNGYPCLIGVNACCPVSASGPADQTIVGDKVSLEAIRNIEIVYGGRFYIDKSGNAVYESRYHRNA